MDNVQKLKKNTSASLLNRAIILLSGFVLPRLILSFYGSETNGLVNSINQFLSIITFLDLGVGSVVQSALYKPLADKDNNKISEILSAAKSYFNKIAYILIGYVLLLIFIYPNVIESSIGVYSTIFLIFSLSISIFSQYYFGIVNELLLNADQKSYIQYNIENVVVILNLIISIFMIIQGYSIETVKLVAGLIYLIRPVYLYFYVSKHYNVSTNLTKYNDPLPQKWNGMAQHIAFSLQSSFDTIALSIFSSLEIVSIYSMYNLVVRGIRLLVDASTAGLKSFLGNILVTENNQTLNKVFLKVEWTMHNAVVYLYGMTAILIVPFIQIYTSGVEDVDYYRPLFAFLLVFSQLAYSIRTPYQTLVLSAGHFKETQLSSIIELLINVVVSTVLVINYGLVGVTIGSLLAMVYRTIYLAMYLSENILKRPLIYFIRQIIVDLLNFSLINFMGMLISNKIQINNLKDWIIVAIISGVMGLFILLFVNLVVYKENMIGLIKKLLRK